MAKKSSITPLGDRVLIKIEEQKGGTETSASGIIIPAGNQEKQADRGKVIAVGEGRVDNNGDLVKPKVKVGDEVVFQWGDKLTIDGEDYYIVSESSIHAIIK